MELTSKSNVRMYQVDKITLTGNRRIQLIQIC